MRSPQSKGSRGHFWFAFCSISGSTAANDRITGPLGSCISPHAGNVNFSFADKPPGDLTAHFGIKAVTVLQPLNALLHRDPPVVLADCMQQHARKRRASHANLRPRFGSARLA